MRLVLGTTSAFVALAALAVHSEAYGGGTNSASPAIAAPITVASQPSATTPPATPAPAPDGAKAPESAAPSPAPSARPAPRLPQRAQRLAPTLLARIDLTRQRMEVIADGKTLHTWPISSGRAGYETPRGTFRGAWMARTWFSRTYDDAPMPHSVFFNDGIAVHGTDSVRLLGRPASRGCIRLAPANAERFYALVARHGLRRTEFVVTGTTPLPAVARRGERHQSARAALRPGLYPTAEPRRSVARSEPRLAARRGLRPSGDGLLRGADGRVFLPRNSPYHGSESFVHNGVVYMRLR